MTVTSTLIENVSAEEFLKELRLIRDELSALKPKDPTLQYLSRQEVATLLKISLPTLNEYTKTGIIKGSRIGSRVLYSESDIKEAIKNIPTLKYRRGNY
ncbi:MAG: helix-turn-helix domain-containing protein [Candidatus Atribacteria bacterium]|nr:helix-turn-helix domain-containing protein [Candidatus Atribacteria bacterium]